MSVTLVPGAPAGGFDMSGDSELLGADFDEENDVDPMSNLTNMVDAMLVLAVGLMMALVTVLNVNLFDLQEMIESDLTQFETPEEIAEQIQNSENAYIPLDDVYQDPATGKVYRLKKADDEAAAADGAASAASAGSAEGGTSE